MMLGVNCCILAASPTLCLRPPFTSLLTPSDAFLHGFNVTTSKTVSSIPKMEQWTRSSYINGARGSVGSFDASLANLLTAVSRFCNRVKGAFSLGGQKGLRRRTMAVHQRSLGSIVPHIKASSYLSINPQSQTAVEHPRPPVLPQSNNNFPSTPSTSFASTSTMDGNVVQYNVNYESRGTDTPKLTLVPVSLCCHKQHVEADSPFYIFLYSPPTQISY